MAGNRSKLNKKTISLIADAIAIGATKEIAAKYAQVSVSCLMHWLQIARDEEDNRENGKIDETKNLYVELLHAIDDAEAELAIECLEEVRKARSQVEGAQWAWKMLAAKYRKDFGEKIDADITSAGKRIRVTINGGDIDDE